MFSFGCCGNVLKQVIDMSNIPIELSTDISIDISNSSIFERDVELLVPLLDISNEQIHVIDAMNVFLNENQELVKEHLGVAQEKLDKIKEDIESIEEVVIVRDRSNTVIIS